MDSDGDGWSYWSAIYGCAGSDTRSVRKTWAAFSAELLGYYRETGAARSTYNTARLVLRDFGRIEGVSHVGDLTAENVTKYLATMRGLSRATAIGRLSYLRKAANEALDSGYLASSPFTRRRRWFDRRGVVERSHHSAEEVTRVLAHLAGGIDDWRSHRLYALAHLIAHTLLRKEEALYLRVDDIDLDRRVIRVSRNDPKQRLKSHAEGHVPICAALRPVLAAWLPRAGSTWAFPGFARARPWMNAKLGKKPCERLTQAAAAVGVRGLTLHALRHAGASYLANVAGMSEALIAQLMRHRSTRTQRHYVHRDDAALRVAMERFDYSA